MLTLLVNQSGQWLPLDIYENEAVNLTFSFQSLRAVNAPSGDYSQTFRLPLTPANEAFFGAFDLGQIMPFDIKAKTEARLLIGGAEIMQGYLQVKGWYLQKGRFVDIEAVFFAGGLNLTAALGEKKLSDLNWASFNHAVNYANVTDSWTGSLLSGQIRYGIVDRGANWRANSNPGNVALQPLDLTPFIRVKTVLEKIFSEHGYTLDSSFFSNSNALYMMLHAGGANLRTVQSTAAYNFAIGFTSNETFTAPSGWTTMQLSDGGNFYDLNNNVAAGQWQVPTTGRYYFRGTYSFSTSNPSATLSLRLWNGTTALPLVNNISAGTGQWGVQALPTTLEATAGQVWYMQFNLSAGNVTFNAGATNGTLGLGGTTWKCWLFAPAGGSLDTARNFPDIRCVDFLSGLQKSFNLAFIPDRYNRFKITVEPLSYYLAAGEAKDWTERVDLSLDLAVTPTAELQKKRYVWTHSEAQDLVNQAFQQSTGFVYGRHEILDPGNDFATGEEIITSGFSPFATSYIPDTLFNIMRLLKSEGPDYSIPNLKPHLAFWNGQRPVPFLLLNGATQVSELFPQFSQFNDTNPDCKTPSLMFGVALPLFDIIANPQQTLYYSYWSAYANELYSSDARMLTCQMRLTAPDIASFKWNDNIFLFGTSWRILEILNYDATQPGLCTVKLLKRLAPIRDCQYLPETGRQGFIEFSTPTGGSLYTVPRECCERYGFYYDANVSKCYQP